MNNECACGSANEVAKQEETAATVVKEESRRTYMPAVDVVDTDSETMLFADMPGVAPDSIDITLEKNTLTVKGKAEKEEYEGKSLVFSEYGVGDYVRTFSLSENVDKENIKAEIKDGVLKISIPKAQPVSKKITVNIN